MVQRALMSENFMTMFPKDSEQHVTKGSKYIERKYRDVDLYKSNKNKQHFCLLHLERYKT